MVKVSSKALAEFLELSETKPAAEYLDSQLVQLKLTIKDLFAGLQA